MKNDLVKKILPHIIAILIFLVVSVIFCKPALEGNVLHQDDIVGWKGMAQSAFDYKEKNGHFPLWNTNVFSGMPNYMIAMDGKSVMPNMNKVLALGLPEPISFFFLACISFYILCLSFRLRPVVGIFGALAFAFATYNPIIITAGHVTKMYAIAYMPFLLAGLINTYEKRYWLGLSLTTLGTYVLLNANHPQISYYFFIAAAIITISYLFIWIRQKEWKHLGIAFGVTVLAAIAGLATTALNLMTSTEYAKATIRGGTNVAIKGDSVTANKTDGLDTDYAFSYSLGRGEELTLLMPNAYGGNGREPGNEDSHVIEKLTAKGMPEANAAQFAGQFGKFWGDPGSSAGGPFYSGVIVCILALLCFVLYKHPIRWGLLAIAVLGVMMAWGKHFIGFNMFLFENLPLYSKFRSPSIAMTIPQFIMPIAAVLALQVVFFRNNAQELLKADFKKILYALGGLAGLLIVIYLMMSYSAPFDSQVLDQLKQNTGSDDMGRAVIAGLKEDRKALFGGQVLRTIAFIALTIGLIWTFMKNILKPIVAVAIFTAISFIDLYSVDKTYLNEGNFRSPDEQVAQTATPTAIDQQIFADKDPHFRVFNAGNERFSSSDYHYPTFHRTLGGYHPAKLRIYQDVIERYLNGQDSREILNMLDAKYIAAVNPQNGQPLLIPNPSAYGAAWLVKTVQTVNDDAAELQAIGRTNLRDTAIVQTSFAKNIAQPQSDSAATLTLSKYDADEIEYNFNASTPQFAVFSEIYYPLGWNAYIDGNKAEYVKADYALRGLSVPAGKHTIKFVFEPASYKKGLAISFTASIIVLILILGGLFMAWKQSRK
ncbi:YfhO family protein [Terrimonas sp. NA20]|uniref:YfhO family protein n=1 Tax=Terrimonas ginsenosidimutans TaxID=2908004 RepID=A0ABS9KSX7_9BACT|nr:YfhO family protein [Terrimonas ginsenosidimutans]MCG2615392.1 YfhO family protein [Terrimonas ginsenosidimutans]